MTDIATLGLRLDASGFVSSADRAIGSLVGMGDSARRTQNQIKNLAVAGGFALGELASGGARDLGSITRAVGGLGFAFGPLIGTVTLAAASIGNAWADSRKRSADEQQKMIDDLHAFEGKFSSEARRARMEALDQQRGALFEQIRGMQFNPFRSLEQDKEIERLSAAMAEITKRYGELANAQADAGRTQAEKDHDEAIKKATEHAKELAREWEKISERVYIATHPDQQAIDQLFQKYAQIVEKRQQLDVALGGVAGGSQAAEAHRAAEQQKTDLDQIIEKLRERLQLIGETLNKEQQRAKTAYDITLGGVIGGAAGVIGGPIGSAVQGGFAGAAGGPLGIAAGAMFGLVNGLDSLISASSNYRAEMERARKAYEVSAATYREQAGTLSGEDAAVIRENAQYEQLVEQLHAAYDVFNEFAGKQLSPEGLEKLDELNRAHAERIKHIHDEKAAIDGINNALRNAPSGFFIERYLGDVVARNPLAAPNSPVNPYTPTGGGGGGGSGGLYIKMENPTFSLEGKTSDQIFNDFVDKLKRRAQVTGGNRASLSSALDLS